ncbi:hypothetical protein FKM82_020586 [Ascaphus truei]
MQIPGLLHRMASLMGIGFHGEVPDEGVVEEVLKEMWKYNRTYKLAQGTAEEKVPVWYIMDEFGSRIQHSDEPTFGTAPLFYTPQEVAYTILWPLRDLENGEEVSCDYAYGESDPLIRNCMLLPWEPMDLTCVSCHTPEPSDTYYEAILAENKETLPLPVQPSVYGKNKIFKIYTDMQQVLSNVDHPRFAFTSDEKEADILISFSHLKDYRLALSIFHSRLSSVPYALVGRHLSELFFTFGAELSKPCRSPPVQGRKLGFRSPARAQYKAVKTMSAERPHVLVNQFPCECLLTVKDCLASVSRRAGGPEGPKWLPRTFNLRTELPQFISYFKQREQR